MLRNAIDAARLGPTDELDGMARLDAFARGIERRGAPHADVDAAIAHERVIAPELGGRTVFDDPPAPRPRRRRVPGRLPLFDR